jgi:hypothetical protein
MTSRSARSLALAAGIAIVVAACGGNAATQTPGATAVATPPPATAAPTQGPESSGGIPSFDTSSFHADQDLESLLPKEIGGEAITALSMSGAQFITADSAPEFAAALTTLGKSPTDLSVAFGGNTKVTIIAFQVDGAPADQILTALFAAYQQETQATISDVTFSGKSVKKVTPSDATEDVSYIYAVRDVVFAVGGTDVTDALLTEAFQKLP